jgi:iron complex transport system ATP-binding protein
MSFRTKDDIMVEVRNLTYKAGAKLLVENFSYDFLPGLSYMVCGPNGAGKTTLLKLIALHLKASSGEIFYNGNKVDHKKTAGYAKTRAVLSQNVEIGFPLEVEEVIMMGRYPHFEVNPSSKDRQICDTVIKELNIESLRERNFLTLSGGEKQRVQFARVLAQIWEKPVSGSRILLLDEPISALDLKYQFDFLKRIRSLLDANTILISVLHDLNLILNYADEVLLRSEAILSGSG